jgi:hypothetical protein
MNIIANGGSWVGSTIRAVVALTSIAVGCSMGASEVQAASITLLSIHKTKNADLIKLFPS